MCVCVCVCVYMCVCVVLCVCVCVVCIVCIRDGECQHPDTTTNHQLLHSQFFRSLLISSAIPPGVQI